MSLFHGLEETRKTKVGSGAVYIKRVKYCAIHGWIDLFACGGSTRWHEAHDKCAILEKPHDIGLKALTRTAA